MEQVLIRFRLVGDEAQALRALSVQEMRHPRDQTRHILRQELERRGLLPAPADQPQPDTDRQEVSQ
jgi:hypothetical protein